MSYAEFEWNLCNKVFTMAVFFPQEYCGIHTLVIQDWTHEVIMITSNKEENVIRVSYTDRQEVYTNYDNAYRGIVTHKQKIKLPLLVRYKNKSACSNKKVERTKPWETIMTAMERRET